MTEDFSDVDLNKYFSSCTNMLSTLGRGRAQTLKKTWNITTQHKMKTSTDLEYTEFRESVFGFLSDMGNEKGVADASTLEPVVGRGDNKYNVAQLYPNCLYMPEHLHIIYNALQNGVEKIPQNKKWIKRLKALERFLSDKSLRRLFMAQCFKDSEDEQLFTHYSSVEIDWRWEALEKALDRLLP